MQERFAGEEHLQRRKLIIVPTIKKASSLAVKQYQTSTFIQDFASKKTFFTF